MLIARGNASLHLLHIGRTQVCGQSGMALDTLLQLIAGVTTGTTEVD